MKKDKRKHTHCSIVGCTGKGSVNKFGTEIFSRGLCSAHAQRMHKYGDPEHPLTYCPKGSNVRSHPLYPIWTSMRARTTNPKDKYFKDYGGRGIKVCERWLGPSGFLNFISDIGDKPSDSHSIDRVNNDGDYCPENVRWATWHEQTANQRDNNPNLGVHWCKRTNKWVAQIVFNKKCHFLGRYTDLEDAKSARKSGEVRFGVTYSDKYG
jgi:hypothetical protein